MPFTDPSLQRARRRRLLQDPTTAAVPSTADIDVAFATDKAKRDVEGKRVASSFRMRRAELAETIRARKADESFRVEQRDIARKQTKIAEGIDLGTLGLQGLSGVHLIKEAERQEQAMDAEIAELEAQGSPLEAHNLKMLKILKGYY